MIPVSITNRILWGPRGRVRSLRDLETAVAAGLPPSALDRVVGYVARDATAARRLRDQLVHPSMQKRRPARLSAEASARLERVARIMAAAEELWGNRAEAQAFVATPHPLLDGRTPLEAARTELGARQVEDVLLQATHGTPV